MPTSGCSECLPGPGEQPAFVLGLPSSVFGRHPVFDPVVDLRGQDVPACQFLRVPVRPPGNHSVGADVSDSRQISQLRLGCMIQVERLAAAESLPHPLSDGLGVGPERGRGLRSLLPDLIGILLLRGATDRHGQTQPQRENQQPSFHVAYDAGKPPAVARPSPEVATPVRDRDYWTPLAPDLP
jgi:hypothetical protein